MWGNYAGGDYGITPTSHFNYRILAGAWKYNAMQNY